MSETAIKVENLSKLYRIGLKEQIHDTITGAMVSWLKAPLKNLRNLRRLNTFNGDGESDDLIWALKDISFEVKHGETLGIIGRNGAGKSTLLKVISRITEPTSGQVTINGRVASLLEVGTGFHPELTGRENIYMNGTILGMTKKEIDRKFDEIVDFSGVEKFIDTPIKRYSSGMQVRLAFSVAAHLEPDILIVDEVLAVGDAEFQEKCLGKMGDVVKEGRTVLFVSHNMMAIRSLCSRAILLDRGRINSNGSVQETLSAYLESLQVSQTRSLDFKDSNRHEGSDLFRFKQIKWVDAKTGSSISKIQSGQHIAIHIVYSNEAQHPLHNIVVSIAFFTLHGAFLFACRSDAIGTAFKVEPGKGCLICDIPKCPLSKGRYFYNLVAYMHGTILDWIKEAGYIDVVPGDYYGTGVLPAPAHQGVYIDFSWKVS
jgi:lipopolysaccharide transport system ATP-binding protein